PKAEAELDNLFTEISRDAGTRTASNFLDEVITFIEALETFPERGTVRESSIPNLRIIGYRRSVSVAFAVREEEVIILGVFARGMDITDELLGERDHCLCPKPQHLQTPDATQADFNNHRASMASCRCAFERRRS
ncbi:type II toxin-antitoxin system RelE/ParE family toxin, partial [Rhizobium rhizogenes]|uniref:type II toxin-antitoxin system RelE/ParE family toxin n=1 Tax=Rhizobium rhizogenes TaxID=359 RepID=UPI002271A1E2